MSKETLVESITTLPEPPFGTKPVEEGHAVSILHPSVSFSSPSLSFLRKQESTESIAEQLQDPATLRKLIAVLVRKGDAQVSIRGLMKDEADLKAPDQFVPEIAIDVYLGGKHIFTVCEGRYNGTAKSILLGPATPPELYFAEDTKEGLSLGLDRFRKGILAKVGKTLFFLGGIGALVAATGCNSDNHGKSPVNSSKNFAEKSSALTALELINEMPYDPAKEVGWGEKLVGDDLADGNISEITGKTVFLFERDSVEKAKDGLWYIESSTVEGVLGEKDEPKEVLGLPWSAGASAAIYPTSDGDYKIVLESAFGIIEMPIHFNKLGQLEAYGEWSVVGEEIDGGLNGSFKYALLNDIPHLILGWGFDEALIYNLHTKEYKFVPTFVDPDGGIIGTCDEDPAIADNLPAVASFYFQNGATEECILGAADTLEGLKDVVLNYQFLWAVYDQFGGFGGDLVTDPIWGVDKENNKAFLVFRVEHAVPKSDSIFKFYYVEVPLPSDNPESELTPETGDTADATTPADADAGPTTVTSAPPPTPTPALLMN